MPQPDVKDQHVDALLTMLSSAYMNDPSAYVADKMFTVVPVAKQSDIIPQYPKAFWFQDEAKLRAPGTVGAEGGFTVDNTAKYFADEYSFSHKIPDERRANFDQPYDPDMEATLYVTDKLLMRREKAFASDFMKTGVWGTDKTPTNLWSDYGLSTPIEDVEDGRTEIHKVTARDPNKLLLGRLVWAKTKHHPDLIERIKYTQRGVLTREIVAAILELDELLIGNSIENTAKEGQTASFSYIHGKHGLLAWVNPRPSLFTPSAGYTFHWSVFGGLSVIRRTRNEEARYDRISGSTYFDQKAVGTDCGYFFNGAVA